MDNAFGLDADYFIRLFARELNPDVVRNQTPSCLARVLARAARTACAEVLAEPEFQQQAEPKRYAAPVAITRAATDVLAERRRQIEAEGWAPEHDDEHDQGQLSAAAVSYAALACAETFTGELGDTPAPATWPWDQSWWKPAGPRRNLVKAGALILAEIERMDRASSGTEASHD